MRGKFAVCLALAAGGTAVAGHAVAQQSVPTVTVTASPTAITLDNPGPLPAGQTRLNFTRPAGVKDLDVYVALMVPGVTVDQVARSLAAGDKHEEDSDTVLGLVSIQASVVLAGKTTSEGVTFNAKPGLTYLVIAEPDAESNGKAKQRAFTTFTTGTDANGAVAPAPAATVRLQGLRFHTPSTLPQKGTIRFENRDGVSHFALAFPVRPGTTSKDIGKALTGNSDQAFGKVVAGQPYMAQNLISGGDVTNDTEVSFPKKGKYALICFINGHERLGMYKVITVK